MDPLKFGIVGVGGYGAQVIKQILGHPEHARIAAVCETNPAMLERHKQTLASAGARVMESFDALLVTDIDAVWLPLPIDLHRPFTERALAAGKAVVVEKPAAGCVQDIDAMIAARDRSQKPVAIGFQHVFSSAAALVKKRLMSGAIGEIQTATILGCWPRGRGYYTRATWAGAIQRNQTWVLDSPANNAMSHWINLTLFLLGQSEWNSANIEEVEAELYRAAPIQNFDTCSIRARTNAGADVLVLMTHACATRVNPLLRIEGTRGSLEWNDQGAIFRIAGKEEKIESPDRVSVIEKLSLYLRGQPIEGAVATLEMARAQSVLVNAASEASTITPIPADLIQPTKIVVWEDECDIVQAVPGIESVLTQCASSQKMLHQSALVPWSNPPRSINTHTYSQFRGPKANTAG